MQSIALVAFTDFQLLDLTAPYEVFSAMSGISVHVVSKDGGPVRASSGLTISPTRTLSPDFECDVIFVPGGRGVDSVMRDGEFLRAIASVATRATFVTSVCTGALILGAAGQLRGKRATTHWNYHSLLRDFGAIPTRGRIVRDGNLFTGGGVTAGIDFALALTAQLRGTEEAQAIQLGLEYAPSPPFDCGVPETCPASVIQRVEQSTRETKKHRIEAVRDAVAAMPD
jgi:cyclohexyl-isocyanide hydratase